MIVRKDMSRPRKCRSQRQPTYPYNSLHPAGIPQNHPPNDFRNFFIKQGWFFWGDMLLSGVWGYADLGTYS